MNQIDAATLLRISEPKARTRVFRRPAQPARRPVSNDAGLRAFVGLYYAIEALRSNTEAFVVQFIDADAGAGSGAMALGYSQVAAVSREQPVLLIECVADGLDRSLLTAPGLLDCLREGRPLSNGFREMPKQPGLWHARLSSSPNMLLDLDSSAIQPFLKSLAITHPIVVLNSPSLEALPASAGLARFCDGTVLVVNAGQTRSTAVTATRQVLERAGGQVIGVAMNGGQTNLPRWLRRWF